ncbi:MAG: NAD(P)/FAD-dependent oxidoreductase [Ardenticatenaceae bacterium]|nr:NAD(P)/FAD-dependent oxidoreductase [Anaerolineales bacterium]MCB8922408.1 NAD(P)/FAD-dependent oxidoreductase [Ardenticatenaceae bacterium]MCB8991340.1 NAD(P)/FAD-dependent oxidoreductase [Ardenticatenaceae bacterium]
MATEKFDVVVIGAGLGGLSAAGYLAKAGKRVLVLEHHTVPGGYAHEFRRGKYRFEVALHALDGAGPGGWAYPTLRELEVLEQVKFERMDPFYTVRFPKHEVVAYADPMKYEAELIRHFPAEAAGIRQLFSAMMQVFFEVRRFMEDGELGRRPSLHEMPAHYPHMLGAMGQSWGEFMDQYIQDPELQGAISTLWAYYGLPPSQLNAATFIFPWVSYHLFGAYYPEGGSMAMSRALEATLKKYGGEVRYRQTVTGIEVVDGMATAVTTEKGLRVEADLIISNANAPDTLLKFVGKEHLPASYASKVADALAKSATGSLVVYLGLERDLLAEGWPHHELFLVETYDVEKDYEAMQNGRFEQTGIIISHYNQADPGCAPEGGSVVTLTTLAPWDYANQWGTGGNLEKYGQNPQYLELKQAAGEALIDRAEAVIPGLRDAIKYVEIGTPLTNYRYSLNPGGSIYGSEQSVENMYLNRLSEKTPIPNLLLAGAWVNGGGMSAALLSGRSVAQRAKAYLDEETAVPLLAAMDEEFEAVVEKEPAAAATLPHTNATLPSTTLTTAGSQRKVTLTQLKRPSVLIFHTQETAAASAAVNQAVRAQYPLADSVFIGSMVDLHNLPKLFRRFAESAMRKSFEEAAAALPAGMKPEEYVVILPDWDGAVTQAVGLQDVDKQAGVAVLDGNGRVVGVYQGDALVEKVMGLLATAVA